MFSESWSCKDEALSGCEDDLTKESQTSYLQLQDYKKYFDLFTDKIIEVGLLCTRHFAVDKYNK